MNDCFCPPDVAKPIQFTAAYNDPTISAIDSIYIVNYKKVNDTIPRDSVLFDADANRKDGKIIQ